MPKLRALSLVQRVYALVRGVGRKRLAVAVVMVVAQSLAEVVGVTSIFPFLEIATDPAGFRESPMAEWLPTDAWSDRELLVRSGCACIGILFASSVISLTAVRARAHYVQSVATHLRKGMLRDALAQPYSFFLERNSSDIYQRIHVDVHDFGLYVLMPLLNIFASVLTICLLLTTVIVAQPTTALIAIAGVAIFYAAIFSFVRPRARLIGERHRVNNEDMIRTLVEAMANIKTVLAFDRARFFCDRFAAASDEVARLLPRAQIYALFPRFLLEPLGLGGVVSLIVAAALSDGALAGALPSLGILALSAYRLLPLANNGYAQLASVATYGHVLAKLERREFAVTTCPPAGGVSKAVTFTDSITFDHVSFCYPRAKKPVLEDVSVCIPKNATVGISGPSGSGKSTFVDLLLGLHTPGEGSVCLDGRALKEQQLQGWRALVAYVPQEVHMFDDTVASNIAFGVPAKQVDHVLLREVAAAAQLLNFIESDLPDGFSTLIGERGARLSGGQRQRLGLARALYRRPEVLVLDEATSALDTTTETMVMDALRQLHGKLTIVVIAHRTDTLNMCDLRLEFPLGLVSQ